MKIFKIPQCKKLYQNTKCNSIVNSCQYKIVKMDDRFKIHEVVYLEPIDIDAEPFLIIQFDEYLQNKFDEILCYITRGHKKYRIKISKNRYIEIESD